MMCDERCFYSFCCSGGNNQPHMFKRIHNDFEVSIIANFFVLEYSGLEGEEMYLYRKDLEKGNNLLEAIHRQQISFSGNPCFRMPERA